MAAQRRFAYNAEFKLKAINHAKEHGNRSAAREFKVNESMVRKWRLQEDELRRAKKTKKSFRGMKARWLQLEDRLDQWISEQRAAGKRFSTVAIRLKAKAIANEMNISDFNAGPSWCFRFMKRRQLSICPRTTVSQQLPADCKENRSGMDRSPLGGLDLSEHIPSLLGSTTMAAGLANVGNTFGGPPSSLVSRPNKFQTSPIEDDDDVVFIEPIQPPQNSSLVADQRNTVFTSSKNEELKGNDCKMLPSPKDLNSRKGSISETIIIDDEEDIETNQGQEKNASSFNERRLPECKNRTNEMEFSPSSFSRSKVNSGIGNSGITTEPDSEIQIANVTTLEVGAISSVSDGHLENDADGRDMNLMITHVTSLQNASLGDVSNGLQSDNFGLNLQTYTPSLTSQTKTGVGPFNPGRMNVAGDVFQNGESVTHHNPVSIGVPIMEWFGLERTFKDHLIHPSCCGTDIIHWISSSVYSQALQQIRHEVSFKNMTHKLCSDHCFNRYRMANGLIMNCCEHCGEYLPSKGAGNNVLTIDGQQKRFCCQNCVGEYKQAYYVSVLEFPGVFLKCYPDLLFHKATRELEGYFEKRILKCYFFCRISLILQILRNEGGVEIICHFCKRNSLPHYQATMPDGKLCNFCSSSCVAKFQALSVQSSTNGQFVSPSDIQLKCNYCKSSFCSKPEVLEWENKVYQFCSRACSDDYKKLHCIVTYCEYCQEEKTLHETVNFSGIKRPFCSEGLFKNVNISLCIKAVRCDCCKSQGVLKEKVQWRGEMKHFCDQHCLLRFYCQQNEPNLATQKGPENLHYDQGCQTPRTKITGSAPPPSPTPNREMKNKAVLCKPLTMTKATYCKPHMQTKSCQTEDEWKKEYVPVPIPVPVYVPVPMNMYSQKVPVPTTVPVPVPVPVFLPTALDSTEKILAAIEELRGKAPSDPLEAELLNLSGVVPEHVGKAEASDMASVIVDSNLLNSESRTSLPDVPYEPDLDIEIDFPRATEELDTENEFLLPPVFGEEYEEQPRPRSKKKGVKRKAVSEYQSHDDSSENSECSFPFKYAYGVNAWKHWVKSRYLDEELPELEEMKSIKSVKLKEDLLSHTSAELNYGLTHFVNEIRRPNGENYAPDSIYYLCLGIQEYLYRSNRKDNIFIDPIYQTFEQELNKILRSWQPSILPDGSIFSRVEEDYLWRIKQLGSHSPVALLNTLFYFNTKYFGLKTVEQHLRLSFGTVFRQWKKNPLTMESKACLRYQVSSLCRADNEDKITTGKRKHEDDVPVFEQIENTSDPARCPVKMFECYLSKSPQNLNQRTDMFYLQPECSVSAESPIWYTATSLDRNTLENMLVRVLLVKDIYDKDNYELDEDID
ncbi:zinc finger MYM-type protein 2 isoform X1 [Turdus rufiventris]|nr:zinc finger MYM-type protein 2 isoform X1 [Turdus rufiventris]